MKPYARGMLVVVFTLTSIVGGVFWMYKVSSSSNYQEVVSDREDYLRPEIVNVSALIVQEDGDQLNLLYCQEEQCDMKEMPLSVEVSALSDGQSWFRYIDVADNQRQLNGQKRVLQRLWVDEEKEPVTIVEQTPLIKPRDLIISRDAQKIAYWLDNTASPQERLTELWVYNEELGGTNLLLENIYRPGIKTRPRWNKASTHLWFVADSSLLNEPERLELVVIDIQPVGATARFLDLDWAELLDTADNGVMDLNLSGRSLAYAVPSGRNRSTLTIYKEGEEEQAITVRGEVGFVQWLEGDRLLYAVQDNNGFTFWQLQGDLHRHVTRHSGDLKSVHGDVRGEYLAFIAQAQRQPAKLFVLHIDSGLSREQLSFPLSGQGGRLVYVEQGRSTGREAAVAGVTSKLDDGQLIAFIEKNLANIIGSKELISSRIVVTDELNTLYVDYGPPDGVLTHRVLLTVRDAIHTEWSIKGRYEVAGVSWRKVMGGGLKDPSPQRVYEWEEKVSQWVLKEEF